MCVVCVVCDEVERARGEIIFDLIQNRNRREEKRREIDRVAERVACLLRFKLPTFRMLDKVTG